MAEFAAWFDRIRASGDTTLIRKATGLLADLYEGAGSSHRVNSHPRDP